MLNSDHTALLGSFMSSRDSHSRKTHGQNTICRRGTSAPLQVAEDARPNFRPTIETVSALEEISEVLNKPAGSGRHG